MIPTTYKKHLLHYVSIFFLLTACEEETVSVLTQAERDDIILQAYFEENQLDPTKTGSGLYYEVLYDSTPANGEIISIHYEGRLLYGDLFDSSYLRDDPFEIEQGTGRIVESFNADGSPIFGTSGVIEGWREATLLMGVGDLMRFYIPSGLAYGVRGSGNSIPPNSILVFDMKLVEVLD